MEGKRDSLRHFACEQAFEQTESLFTGYRHSTPGLSGLGKNVKAEASYQMLEDL